MAKRILIIALILVSSLWLWNKYGYLARLVTNAPESKKIDTNPVDVLVKSSDPKLDFIDLPDGFKVNYFADNVPGARSLTMGADGTVYVGTRKEGVVYALEDKNRDGIAEKRYVVVSERNAPNGIAYLSGDLYVAEATRIIKFAGIDDTYASKPNYQVIYAKFPLDTQHSWKYLAIGPNNKLYVPVGMPCNVCEKEDPFGTIMRLELDGKNPEIVARGVRNSVGFDWNPIDQTLWFTDNGRDSLGEDLPPDELNRLCENSDHFGFPYCHAGSLIDPEYGEDTSCSDYVSPAITLGPHVAALGMKFYRGNMFPPSYRNKIFIAEHGSWNREVPIGYRVSTVDVSGETASNYATFAGGWLSDEGKTLGRPVDILELEDGSLLISDDFAGAIYRITYTL